MASYYVDATLGDDEGTGEIGDPWKTIGKVRGEAFSPSDNIYFKKDEEWRDCLEPPSEGTSGNPITFGAYGSGDDPVIMGSTEATGWTLDSGSIWKASFTISGYDDPATVDRAIWFVETDSSIKWGDRQTSKVNCVNEYDWYYDLGATTLYVYAATDPDTRYSSVEVPTENYIIRIAEKSYLTFEYLHLKFGYVDGTWINGNADTDRTFQYLEVHHIGDGSYNWGVGIGVSHTNDTAKYNTVYQCGEAGIKVGMAGANRSNMLIEYNTCYDCYHSTINIHDNESHTHDNTIVRYNEVYATDDWVFDTWAATGIYVQNAATNLKIYYNLVHDLPNIEGMSGIAVTDDTSGSQFIYNNVVYKCYNNFTTGSSVTATIKNNISFEAYNFLMQITDDTNITCDYNCVYEGAGSFKTYTSGGGTDTSWADYRSGSGFDEHGISADPLFVDAANDDFHLQPDSPCIDEGDDVGLTEDFAGTSVPLGGGVDMGAYEAILNALYGKGREAFLAGDIDWANDTIKAVLVDSADYTPNLTTHDFLNDIPSAGQVAISDALAGKSITLGVADANDLTVSGVSGDKFEYIVLFKDTGDSATSPLIICIDSAIGLPFTPGGGNVTLKWSALTNKIFKL